VNTTPLDDALERVSRERTVIRDMRSAFDQFESEVRQLSPASSGGQARHVTDGGVTPVSNTMADTGSGTDRCRTVCELFAETVQPHSTESVDGDEPVLETIRNELGEELALALAPTTGAGFDKTIKQGILSATRQRQTELDAMTDALAAESESLRSAQKAVTSMAEWLESADRESMLSLDFTALRDRHETLVEFEERTETLLRDRQRHLHASTGTNATVGVTHLSLAEYLYGSFTSAYPVLSVLTRFLNCIQKSQRAVRDHLVRRV
jgi:hypothetical protein